MIGHLKLNVPLLRRRVPNLTTVAKAAGLRPATVSNLCTGKIPLERAEVRTLVALATLAGCTLDELVIRDGGIEMMESGIKVIDLFSPLVRGGTIGLIARSDMGQLVLVQELLHRFNHKNYVTIVWSPINVAEINNDNHHRGLKEVIEQAQHAATTLDEIYSLIENHRNDKDIILVADRRTVISGGLWTLQDKLVDINNQITTLLMDITGDAADENLPYGPLETSINFDINLVTRMLYPAIDPVTSTSSLLEDAQLDVPHVTIHQRARKLLRRYKELRALVSVWGIDRLSDMDKVIYHRGERLEAFLSQPFYVAEPFTSRQGESVSLEDILQDSRRILDGVVDDYPIEAFQYIGKLSF